METDEQKAAREEKAATKARKKAERKARLAHGAVTTTEVPPELVGTFDLEVDTIDHDEDEDAVD